MLSPDSQDITNMVRMLLYAGMIEMYRGNIVVLYSKQLCGWTLVSKLTTFLPYVAAHLNQHGQKTTFFFQNLNIFQLLRWLCT